MTLLPKTPGLRLENAAIDAARTVSLTDRGEHLPLWHLSRL